MRAFDCSENALSHGRIQSHDQTLPLMFGRSLQPLEQLLAVYGSLSDPG
jgi:hypothetical protein